MKIKDCYPQGQKIHCECSRTKCKKKKSFFLSLYALKKGGLINYLTRILPWPPEFGDPIWFLQNQRRRSKIKYRQKEYYTGVVLTMFSSKVANWKSSYSMRQIILSCAGWEDIVIKTKKLQTKLSYGTKYSELQEKKKQHLTMSQNCMQLRSSSLSQWEGSASCTVLKKIILYRSVLPTFEVVFRTHELQGIMGGVYERSYCSCLYCTCSRDK